MAGASSLTIECQRSRIEARLRTRYLDEKRAILDDALARIGQATRERQARSIVCWQCGPSCCRNWPPRASGRIEAGPGHRQTSATT